MPEAVQALRDQGLDDRPMRELQHATLAGTLPRHGLLPDGLPEDGSIRTIPSASGAAVPGLVTVRVAENRHRSAEIALKHRKRRACHVGHCPHRSAGTR